MGDGRQPYPMDEWLVGATEHYLLAVDRIRFDRIKLDAGKPVRFAEGKLDRRKPVGDSTLAIGAEFAPWQIKDFSVAIRQEIARRARQQDVTVAEWLHGYFTRYGFDGMLVLSQQALPEQTEAEDRLYRMIDAVSKLPDCRERKALANAIARRLRQALPPMLPKPAVVGSDGATGRDLRLDAPPKP
jgi:hypothetical protein